MTTVAEVMVSLETQNSGLLSLLKRQRHVLEILIQGDRLGIGELK